MELLDVTQYILLGAVIAGVTEMLNRARAKDWWVVVSIGTSGLIGLAFGLLGVEGLTPVLGLAVGFGVSGTLKGFSVFGKKSEAVPSAPLTK